MKTMYQKLQDECDKSIQEITQFKDTMPNTAACLLERVNEKREAMMNMTIAEASKAVW